MKGCLIFGAAVVVIIGAIIGGVLISLRKHAPDMREYSLATKANVVATRNMGDRDNVVYSYTYEGVKYYGKVWYSHRYWNPPGGFVVCLDPKRPAEHVTSLAGLCGSSDLVADPQQAKKTQPSVGGGADGGGLP